MRGWPNRARERVREVERGRQEIANVNSSSCMFYSILPIRNFWITHPADVTPHTGAGAECGGANIRTGRAGKELRAMAHSPGTFWLRMF